MDTMEGAVAVITGAGSGIGRATALELAARGAAAVVVSDLDAERATGVAAEVRAAGVEALAVRCDVASDGDVADLAAAVLGGFDRVDLVMSNVGVLALGQPTDIPIDAWARILDVNLLGTVRVVQAFLPTLVSRGRGHLVTTGSTAGLFPYAYDRLPYAASKAGVVAFSESLALHLRPHGVGVTCFCPAGVVTNIVEQITVYGAPSPVQEPQVPLVSAEDAARTLVDGVLADRLLVLGHPAAEALLAAHARDRDAFLAAQIDHMEGRT